MTLAEIRKRYPEYNDLSDQELADAFHSKFYSDMPRSQFDQQIGLAKTAAEPPGFLQRTGEIATQMLRQMSPGFAAITAPREQQQGMAVTGISALNTATLGVPEMAARAMGAGPSIEAAREAYPSEAAVGDIAGLAFPASVGYRAAGAVGRTLRGPQPTILQKNAQGSYNVNIPRPALSRAAATGAKTAFGALPGAQVAAGGAGAARMPESPVTGAVMGSSELGQRVADFPLLRQIPGYSSAVRDVSQAVPFAMGLGGAQLENYLETDRRIREEAARRALQGQR